MQTGRELNPVERYTACFPSVGTAAAAAGISTEMLRRMRLQGFVSTRDRALRMAAACGDRVSAVELMGLAPDDAAGRRRRRRRRPAR